MQNIKTFKISYKNNNYYIMWLERLQRFQKENKEKYRLGGCCISNDDPAFSCNDCGMMFGNREEEEDG